MRDTRVVVGGGGGVKGEWKCGIRPLLDTRHRGGTIRIETVHPQESHVSELTITPQPTPNPNAYKFVTNRPLCDGPARTFYSAEAAAADPLAAALFALPGVTGVMILNNFCSVNQDGSQEWADLIPKVQAILTQTQ